MNGVKKVRRENLCSNLFAEARTIFFQNLIKGFIN